MMEPFRIEARQQDTIWIFSTHGYINNFGGEAIAKKFEETHEKGGRRFLLDLAGSKIINSIGISFLIEILEKTIESRGELAFCNCAPIVEKTFKIMGLTQYARIYKTADDAISGMLRNV